MENLFSNINFYDELATSYDEMIAFDNAVKNKNKLLKYFISQKIKQTAADIGCGSGVDSIALAELGLKVTAFDPSNEMLKVAEVNSKKMNVEIKFTNYTADKIPLDFDNKFDLVVSLGNTFANIPTEKFGDSIRRCFDILKRDGQLILQILNYEKILAEKQRIVNITGNNDNFFIRFYDFYDEQIVFNILNFNKNNPANHKLISTKIYPYTSDIFFNRLAEVGFKSIQLFSNLELTSFDKMTSRDLIIRALKI